MYWCLLLSLLFFTKMHNAIPIFLDITFSYYYPNCAGLRSFLVGRYIFGCTHFRTVFYCENVMLKTSSSVLSQHYKNCNFLFHIFPFPFHTNRAKYIFSTKLFHLSIIFNYNFPKYKTAHFDCMLHVFGIV